MLYVRAYLWCTEWSTVHGILITIDNPFPFFLHHNMWKVFIYLFSSEKKISKKKSQKEGRFFFVCMRDTQRKVKCTVDVNCEYWMKMESDKWMENWMEYLAAWHQLCERAHLVYVNTSFFSLLIALFFADFFYTRLFVCVCVWVWKSKFIWKITITLFFLLR